MSNPTEPHQPRTARRDFGLDALKGLLIVCMTLIHGRFFFQSHLLEIPFNPLKFAVYLDSFVFSTYMVCFGAGYAFSKRLRTWHRLSWLLGIYYIGGIASLVGTRAALPDATTRPFSEQLIEALTLQRGFPYASFVLPYACVGIIFHVCQSFLHPDHPHRGQWMIGLSILGIAIDAVNRQFGFLPVLTGFPCFSALVLFFVGFELGLSRRRVGHFPANSRKLRLVAFGALAIVVVGTRILYPSTQGLTPWKQSGAWTYLAFGAIVGFLLVVIAQEVDSLRPNWLTTSLVWLGRHATSALAFTMTALPLTGALASRVPSTNLRSSWFLVFLALCSGAVVWFASRDRSSTQTGTAAR